MSGKQLGPYTVDRLSNENAGYCMWGFGTRGGREYFIKQFLSPKFPYDDKEASPERLQRKRQECRRFEEQKRAIYSVLNQYSDGNDVRVLDFFRCESRYYMCMEKVYDLHMTVEQIHGLPTVERLRLCASIAHAVAGLHRGGLVHADLKHDNILFTYTQGRRITAKVIDFDSSFLESDPPQTGEDIIGDQLYFSPEARLSIEGEPVPLTCKMDVFALGVLFHQYLAGDLPIYDMEVYAYPADAVLDGRQPEVAGHIPEEVADILRSMLEAEAEDRPTAWEVFLGLRRFLDQPVTAYETASYPGESHRRETAPPEVPANPWSQAGDLL